MNHRSAFALVAFFVLLSSPLTHGGEWHSAGNAPTPPYYPSKPANYRCHIVAHVSTGGKQYRVEHNHDFLNEEFQPPGSGTAAFTLSGETDPGMNGHWMSLRFSPKAQGGGEDLTLSLGAVVAQKSHTSRSLSTSTVDRAVGNVQGRSAVNVSSEGHGERDSASAEISASCVELR